MATTAAAFRADEQEAAAADSGIVAVHNAQGEGGGDSCINGVATLSDRFDGGIGCI
jgi:hypothetical protein